MPDLCFTWLRRGDGERPVLVLEGLTVRVGLRRVLDDLSLRVCDGDVVMITGPNGSGKSTLLDAVAGVGEARIEAGRVSFLGEDVTCLPAHQRAARGLAYLRQRSNVLPDLTVEENFRLALGADGLVRFRDTFPEWAEALSPRKKAGLLSGGQQQRLAWAMTVLRPNQLILADEPEVGLANRLELPVKGTQLVVSHNPSLLQV